MIKTFQQLRDFIAEAKFNELEMLLERNEHLYESFYRTQGYVHALDDIDALLRDTLKYQDNVE